MIGGCGGPEQGVGDADEPDPDGNLDADVEDADAERDLDADAEADVDVVDGDEADVDGDDGDDADVDVVDGDDADVDVEPELPGPVIVLHLTDVHVGFEALSATALAYALSDVIDAVSPAITLISGDLVDEGNEEAMWEDYQEVVDVTSPVTAAEVVEAVGNHDTHGDYALAGFLAHSVTGRASGVLFDTRVVGPSGRRLRIVRVNTASAGDRLRNLTGYLQASQVDELIEQIDADPEPASATIIVGHHPMQGINGLELHGTAANLRRLIDYTEASAYLFGHVHISSFSWIDEVLHVQGPTLGHGSFIAHPGFCVLAIDDDGPVVRQISLEEDGDEVQVSWPQVLITTPADGGLGGGNPMASPLPRASTGQLVRAAVFSQESPDDVSLRVLGGSWTPMTPVGRFWEGTIETPDAESMTLEVRAAAGVGLDTHRIDVQLE